MDDLELIPLDDEPAEDFELIPLDDEPRRSFARAVPGGGSALAQQAPAQRSLLDVPEEPAARTARAMSDVELALSGDPEMRQFEYLSTEPGRQAFGKSAARLPGNIKTSVGATLTEMASGAEEFLGDSLAETSQRKADEARAAIGKPVSLLDPMTWRSDSELERMARRHMQDVRSNLAASDEAAARAQAAREGGAEAVPADAGPVERAVQGGATSSAIAVPAVMLGGPIGGSALMGTGTAAQRRSELLAAGVPEADANQSAALLGGLEALTEFIPGQALVKKIPGFNKHLTEFMVSELPGENVNALAQLVDDYRLELRDDVTMDDVVSTITDTTLAAAAGSGIQVGAVHTIQKLAEAANARAAERAAPAGRQEPDLGEVPIVPRGSTAGAVEPDLGTIAADESLLDAEGDSARVLEQTPDRTKESQLDRNRQPRPAAKMSGEDGALWDELGAVKEGRATPEEVARLEQQGYVIRSETNVPRLLPAGRRRLSEIADRYKGDIKPEPGLDAPESLAERLARDPPLRSTLEQMRDEAGWAERGGHLIRDPDSGEVTGRTAWVPRAEWWTDRPEGFAEGEVREAVDRALAGEKLGKRDTRIVEFMRDVHDERARLEAFLPVAGELPEQHDIDDRYETAMVARATEIDEAAVERLAIQHDDDQDAFLTGIKALLDGHDHKAAPAGREAGERAPRQATEEGAQTAGVQRGLGSRPRLSEEERLVRGRAAIAATEAFGRDLEAARAATNAEPTEAQKSAGNYAKGTLKFGGMTVALENPKGSTRTGKGKDGATWSREMTHDYGYVKGTEGRDGDQVDVYLAGAPDTGRVFVVNQVDPSTGRFDEHKAILGAHTRQEAEKIYRSHYPKGWKGLGSLTELPTADFRKWVSSGNTKRPLDRRADPFRRQRVAEMQPEDLRRELLTHELTKIPNRRAYEEAPKKATQVSVDVDSLKWVNDNMGHESGNELLKAVATALKDETAEAYHISGDEFVVQANSPAEARAIMERVGQRLAGARIEVEMPDGTIRTVQGLGVSFGLGGNLEAADIELQAHKAERETKGQRAGRGQTPPGATVRSVQGGREDQTGGATEEVARFSRRRDKPHRMHEFWMGRDPQRLQGIYRSLLEDLRRLGTRDLEDPELWDKYTDDKEEVEAIAEERGIALEKKLPTFSIEPVTGDPALLARAVKEFGYTTNVRHAGFIMPNGRMLDLGGAGGVRSQDHRAIGRILDDESAGTTTGLWEAMRRTGMVRIHAEQGGRISVSVMGRPTDAAIRTLEKIASKGVIIGVKSPDGTDIVSREIEEVTARGLIKLIEDTYSGKSDVRFSRRVPDRNYTTDLSTYAPTMFRETNIEQLMQWLPEGQTYTDMGYDVYLSDTPDLALGQGGNKGVLLELDPQGLQGHIDLSKPLAAVAFENGAGEYVARYNRQGDYHRAVRAFTIQKDAQAPASLRSRFRYLVRPALKKNGWNVTKNEDGSETWRRPESVAENNARFARRTTPIDAWELKAFADRVKSQLGLEEFDLRPRSNGDIHLELIMVPKSGLGAGTGTAAMQRLVEYADSRNARIVLSPAGKEKRSDWGTTSKARLERFYRRFGFVSNKGRNKDFSISDAMYREPNEAKYSRAGKRVFNEWFGNSRVVDTRGNPLRVFHGTNQPISQFDPVRRGMSTTASSARRGFFFTSNPVIASEYAENAGKRVNADLVNFEQQQAKLKAAVEAAQKRRDWDLYEELMAQWEDLEIGAIRADTLEGQNLFPAYLKIENPLEVDFKGGMPGLPGGTDHTLEGLIDRALEEGRDGVIMRNLVDSPQMSGPSDQFVVFSSEQIRSAITLKRQSVAPARGMPVQAVQETVRQVLAGASLSKVPPVEVVSTYRDLPPALRDQLVREQATDTTGAIFLPGIHGDRVILIAENNATEDEIRENVYHELVGHYGLTQIMDAERYNEIMDGIYRDMPDRVRESARRNGLDLKDEQQRRIAAEEVIAYAAGNILTGKPVEGAVTTWWKKLLEAVRAFFQRALGKERFNDAAIARIVAASKKALEGQAAGVHKSLREGALRHQRPPLYYSQLFAAVNDSKVPNVAPPAEYAKIIRSKVGKEIKPDEMEWSGVLEFLDKLSFGELLWRGNATLPDISVPDEARPHVERFRELVAWQRKHAGQDFRVLKGRNRSHEEWGAAMEAAIDEAERLGFSPRYQGDDTQMQYASVWGLVGDAVRNMRESTELGGAPRRIPKSVVLDYLNSEQISIDVVPSYTEEPETRWLNLNSNYEPSVVDLTKEYLDTFVTESISDEDIERSVVELIHEDPAAWLDDEDSDAIVDPVSDSYDINLITEEMIDRARRNSNVREQARFLVERAMRQDENDVYLENPVLEYKLSSEDGAFSATITGRDSEGWNGVLIGRAGLRFEASDPEDADGVAAKMREFIRQNADRLIRTKYSSYAVPGGTEYGERLFVWDNPTPSMAGYSNSHWETDNVLLHTRFDTRQGPKGEKILFLDEIQSDWHQAARDSQKVVDLRQKLVREVDDFSYLYRSQWSDPGTERFPGPRAEMHKWLEELPITGKQFRQILIDSKSGERFKDPLWGYMYAWLEHETRKPAIYWRDQATEADANWGPDLGAKKADPLLSLPDDFFNWKRFVAYLKDMDADHEKGVLNAEDASSVARFLKMESRRGESEATNHLGGLPPSLRIVRSLIDKAMYTIPVHWNTSSIPEVDRESLLYDWEAWNEYLNTHLDQFTPEMAGSQAGRAALASIEPLRAAYLKVRIIEREGLVDPSMARGDAFKAETGMEYAAASVKIEEAVEVFAQTARMVRISHELDRLTRHISLELSERAERIETAHSNFISKGDAKPVPPLAKSWPLAALKWALRHAAENGHTQIALAPGSVHGSRWGATASYERINVYPETLRESRDVRDGTRGIVLFDPAIDAAEADTPIVRLRLFRAGNADSLDVVTTPARMGGWIGKDAAEAIAQQKGQIDKDGVQRLTSVSHGVTIWGPNNNPRLRDNMDRVRDIHHGSMEIYNSILPFQFNKFLGKYGAKIRPGKMQVSQLSSLQEKGLTGELLEPDVSKWKVTHPSRGFVTVVDEIGAPISNMRDRGESDDGFIAAAKNAWRLDRSKALVLADVPIIDLNDKLKDAALNRGFPLFARRWTHGARQLGNAVNQGSNQFTSPLPSLASRVWNYLVYHAQDKFIDLLRTQKAVAAWRGAVGIPDGIDAYMRQTLYHGRAEARTEEFEKTYVEPLVKMIKDSGYDWTEVEDYLYARHAPEANARIAAINPGKPQYNSGMSDQDAAAAMNAYLATPNFAQLQAIGRHVDAMTKFSRDMMVMEGLEDPAVVQAWEQTYQYYVPLKGWAGLDIQTDMPKRGRGFDVGGKLTKMRTGRTSRAATILANVVAQAQSTIILAEKAKVGRALYDFTKSTPAPDLWVVDQVEYMRYVDPNSGLVRSGVNPAFKLADNILRVRQNGQDFHITFNPENEQMVRLAAAMKNLGADKVGPIFTLLHGVNRVLSTLNTSLNPEFVITNALRDLTTAMANLTEQEKAGLRRQVLRDWRAAWWGIRRGLRGKQAAWAQEWTAFQRAGGKVGWIDHYKSPQDLEKKLRRHLSKDNVLTYTVKGVRAVGEFIENENMAVENAIRLSTFVNLRKAGLSTDRAAEAAKNLTVNFNRKGELGTVMNSLYLFYNASAQGTARLWQLAKHPKGRYVMAGFVVAGIVQSLLMRFIGGDDEDEEKLYDKVPEHDKEKNIIIMIPPHLRRDTASGEKPYFKVMLPYGFNTLFYSGTKLGNYFDYALVGNVRRVNPGADAGQIAGSFLGAFSPIGDAEGGLSQFLLPTLADPFVQLADNKSWWGGKIMPTDFDEEAPSPDSQKYFQSVPAAYKDFAAWMNERTGGTEISPGAIDVSPETFQHWSEFATGGAGRFAEGIINAPYKAIVHPEELTTQEIPFWRKVVGSVGDRATQETFFTHINELKYVKREIDAVYKIGVTTEEGQARMAYIAQRYPVGVKMVRAAYPNFANSRGAEDLDKDRIVRSVRELTPGSLSNEPRPRAGQRKAITTVLSDARKEIRRLEARTGLPAKEREEKIRAQKQLIHDSLLEFNRQWNEVEDATFGERNQGKLIEKLGPLISGKKRKDQVRTLREAGYSETADLLAGLPPIPDRFAREYFLTETVRDTEP